MLRCPGSSPADPARTLDSSADFSGASPQFLDNELITSIYSYGGGGYGNSGYGSQSFGAGGDRMSGLGATLKKVSSARRAPLATELIR